ncbi:hypothetical protein KOR34_50620 [Posidoniimonas corsicana]|uniref:Dockerin domain-containing protein n=1 Tax=Posidoniimonas corsicana TaxID=1938618 RepID=A0A5C5UXY4_9BACT|nr:dockerin type I domain-containing protein [Posidoniimonas corsicana]TWT30503.1 hypothetical protein KOR34_50620 [Posidoniimonas corsicana]
MTRPLTTVSLSAALLLGALAAPLTAANQTATTTPVIVGGAPYQVDLRQYDAERSFPRPSLHSFVAGEHSGQWVVIGGLTNGMHGFDIDNDTIPERKQNAEVWVIDPVAKTSWSRSLVPGEANSGLTDQQLLTLYTANAQFEQVGDRLYITGGFGDDSLVDPSSRDTFDYLTAVDLPGIVDWAKGGTGQAADHIRQTQDDLFKVTGGDMLEIDGQMHLVFGQDFNQPYNGNAVNGEYTKQVRTFTIQDDGTNLGFTAGQSSTPESYFRRRDLNVFPTVRQGEGQLEEGITVLSGVFTSSRGAWTVPVEIDASGVPAQIDYGNNPLNSDGSLDADPRVFKQAMNNYHSAKLGMFSEASGAMHEVLMGGITLQEYDPDNPAADAYGFVTDVELPNTSQVSSVVRGADGAYQQHYLGAYPELYTDEETPQLMRFGSNAEFFLADGIETYDNGVIKLDALPFGETVVGYVYGGLITNAPHVFRNPVALSSASGEIFEVAVTLLAGDYNRDGLVDAADYTVWRDTLGQQVTPGTGADGSGDGDITAADYAVWRNQFGATLAAAASTTAAPEPAAVLLLGWAAVLGRGRRRG